MCLLKVCILPCLIIWAGNPPFAYAGPFFTVPAIDTGSERYRTAIVQFDQPVEGVLEAVAELGGKLLILVPAHDYDKRDSPDLGTGRSYSGQQAAKAIWGQLASTSPGGPGKRKRDTKLGLKGPVNFEPEVPWMED